MMIRFKVVKASKLLLFFAIVLLFAATCFIMVRYSLSREPQIQTTSAELVHSAAETQTVFAARGISEKGEATMSTFTGKSTGST